MTWRRFSVLLSGLSPEAIYRYAMRGEAAPKPLTAADASSFFASFPKAGN